MPGRTRSDSAETDTLEDRWLLELQTARNLEAISAEQDGKLEVAVSLYERNVAEGFPGDLPYGRLAAIYVRFERYADADRVLRRAIGIFETSTRRTPQDRRATLRAFKQRLTEVRRLATRMSPPAEGRATPPPAARSQ
jgi:hypothetical protein